MQPERHPIGQGRVSPQDKETALGYLIAAYTITAAVLVAYGLVLLRERAVRRARHRQDTDTAA